MTHYLRVSIACAALTLGLLWGAAAQEAPALAPAQTHAVPAPSAAPAANSVHVDEEFIHKQFGEQFSLIPTSTPMVRDLDGDGIDDMVISAQSKKPMLDAAEHMYRVIDPYYTFYGYGDPRMTTTFGSEDLQTKHLVVLIIHGAGTDAWRSETPKAKFVVINLPFKMIAVRRLQLRKRQINAIYAEEENSTAADSVVFWDGKQYRYQPLGMSGADD